MQLTADLDRTETFERNWLRAQRSVPTIFIPSIFPFYLLHFFPFFFNRGSVTFITFFLSNRE